MDIMLESQLIRECGSMLIYEDMIYPAVPVKFIQRDFPYYDWILVMDDRNYEMYWVWTLLKNMHIKSEG